MCHLELGSDSEKAHWASRETTSFAGGARWVVAYKLAWHNGQDGRLVPEWMDKMVDRSQGWSGLRLGSGRRL